MRRIAPFLLAAAPCCAAATSPAQAGRNAALRSVAGEARPWLGVGRV